jgi:hypothetical protein
MQAFITDWSKRSATLLEHVLALAVVVGVVVFSFFSVLALSDMDWRVLQTFYELINRALLMAIGVELARTLWTRELEAILELLAFVVARKMLNPEVTSIDIFLSVAAFVGLLVAHRYFIAAPAAAPVAREIQ